MTIDHTMKSPTACKHKIRSDPQPRFSVNVHVGSLESASEDSRVMAFVCSWISRLQRDFCSKANKRIMPVLQMLVSIFLVELHKLNMRRYGVMNRGGEEYTNPNPIDASRVGLHLPYLSTHGVANCRFDVLRLSDFIWIAWLDCVVVLL